MLLLGCILLAQAGPAQDAAAEELWRRVCEATAATGESKPISEFALQAEVLTRDGVQTNEFKADYRWLAPNHIRFMLESGRETGRGTGRGQKAYWLKEKDEIVILEGREHAQDRKLVDEMIAVARNFVAFTDPAKLETTKLALEPPPSTIHELHRLRRLAEKVRWLSFSSPDFALFRENAAAKPDAERGYRVQVGVDAKSSLPRLAIVHEETPGAKAAPMLVQLGRYEKVVVVADDDEVAQAFWVPKTILVYRLVRTDDRIAFDERPAQEIYVTRMTLRPGLKPTDFEP